MSFKMSVLEMLEEEDPPWVVGWTDLSRSSMTGGSAVSMMSRFGSEPKNSLVRIEFNVARKASFALMEASADAALERASERESVHPLMLKWINSVM